MAPPVKSPVFGYGIILFASLLFSTYGVWAHLMGATFAPFYQAWVRSIIIMLILLPFLLATKSFIPIKRKDWLPVGIYTLFCIFTQVPLYYAYNHAPLGAVQLIFYAVYLIVSYLIAQLYLGERITTTKLAAMALAFVGLAVVFGSSALAFAPLGLALAALNGVASGGEVSSTKRISDTYSPLLLAFVGWTATLVTHLPISLLVHEQWVAPQLDRAWLWLVVYAAVSALAFWLVIEGYRHVDATIGSIVGLSEIVFTITLGSVVFAQGVTWSVLIGCTLILAAGTLPNLIALASRKHIKQPIEPLPGI